MTSLAGMLRARLGRLQLRRIPPPILAWTIACWIVASVLVIAVAVPGFTDEVTAEPRGSAAALALFLAPLGFRLLVLAGAAVTAGASLVTVRAPDAWRAHPVRREFALAGVLLPPGVLLLADGSVLLGLAALALAAGALIAVRARAADRRRVRAVLGLVAAAPWLVLAGAQLLPGAPVDDSWTWAALFGIAAAFAAFSSYYGVQRAAESRSRAVGFLFRDELGAGLVLLAVVATTMLVALRLTVAREVFPEPDPSLWAPFAKISPLSWLVAGVVAAVIVGFAIDAHRRPLLRRGDRAVSAGLAVVGNVEMVLSAGVIGLAVLVAALNDVRAIPDAWIAWVAPLKVLGVAAIGLLAALPALRGTAARRLAIVSAVYLLPATTASLLFEWGVALPPGVEGYAATPVQVLLWLLLAAVVLAVAAIARRPLVGSSLVVRLAVVPLVTVHAGWLLPAAWSDLGRVVLVVGVVLALLVLLPEPSPDADRHGTAVLGIASAQVLALVVFALAVPSLFDDASLVVLGLLWLSVTTIASLVLDTRPVPSEATTPATVASPRPPEPEDAV